VAHWNLFAVPGIRNVQRWRNNLLLLVIFGLVTVSTWQKKGKSAGREMSRTPTHPRQTTNANDNVGKAIGFGNVIFGAFGKKASKVSTQESVALAA